jgi:hypothetical protein
LSPLKRHNDRKPYKPKKFIKNMATIDRELIVRNVKLWREANSATAAQEQPEKENKATEYKSTVIAEVKKDPKQILRELTQSQLIELAAPHLGAKDQAYRAGRSALGSNDESVIRRAVEEMYGPNSVFGIMSISQPTAILRESLEKEVSRRTKKHMKDSLKLDMKTGKIERSTTIKFIAPNIETDDQMFDLGRRYEAATLAKAA